jgi:hypothetical protein
MAWSPSDTPRSTAFVRIVTTMGLMNRRSIADAGRAAALA